MTKEKWTLPNGKELHIETVSPYPDGFSEDDIGHSWYAADFLQFVTSILWDTYPTLRPLIKRASNACWKVWRKDYQEKFGQKLTDPTCLHSPPFMRGEYGRVVAYYMKNIDSKLIQLLNGLFSGRFYEIEDADPDR